MDTTKVYEHGLFRTNLRGFHPNGGCNAWRQFTEIGVAEIPDNEGAVGLVLPDLDFVHMMEVVEVVHFEALPVVERVRGWRR